MYNKITLVGRVCTDIDLKTTNSGVNVAQFRLAVDSTYTKEGERKTNFINIVAWRKNGEFASKYFSKGRMMGLDGELNIREYTTSDGQKKTIAEIVVDKIFFVDSKSSSPENSVMFSDPQEQPKQEAFNVLTSEEDLPF